MLPRKLRDIKRMRNRKLDQPVVETVSKKKFIRALDRLGVQLRAKDIALIFDRLDTAGKGKVNREDVLDFFELTDVELEGVLIQADALHTSPAFFSSPPSRAPTCS